jgi:transposase
MSFKNFIGVDVSKRTLDICLITASGQRSFYQCPNTFDTIAKTLKSVYKEHALQKDETLLCAEHTSYYTQHLQKACIVGCFKLWLENPSQIKCSQGVQRGKNDKQDAGRIAVYAQRFTDKAIVLEASKAIYEQLAYLNTERELLLTDASKYRAQLKDEAEFIDPKLFKAKKRRTQRLIKELEASLAAIDLEISELIDKDPHCKQQYQLLTSIDGIGKQVAVHTIIETKGFTRFTDPRKFACHAGVAPFKYFSGSSIRSTNKVSHKANKKLKTLLHMAALAVIRMKSELRVYYERKVAEGKNKMSVINAIRAKLISRMFAVINNNTKYIKNLQPAIV